MSKRRVNAPLLEVIAELRWDAVPEFGGGLSGQSGHAFIIPQNKAEAFYMRFAMEANGLGHTVPERLIPAGFPTPQNQPVVRFSRTVEGRVNTLYQIGPGIFSANAVPPYESWGERFQGVVKQGVAALINTRSADEIDKPFTGLMLRYIDAFDERHIEGRSVREFMRDVLKIDVLVPESVAQLVHEGRDVSPSVQLQIPMAGGFVMGLSVGQGIVEGRTVIILDSSVAATIAVPCVEKAVMDSFQAAHDVLSATFRQLTESIGHLMPVDSEAVQ